MILSGSHQLQLASHAIRVRGENRRRHRGLSQSDRLLPLFRPFRRLLLSEARRSDAHAIADQTRHVLAIRLAFAVGNRVAISCEPQLHFVDGQIINSRGDAEAYAVLALL